MIWEFVFPLSLLFPGLSILKLAGIRTRNNIERLSLSYILSLAMILCILYLGGIVNAFNVASFMVFAIFAISFIHLFVLLIMRILRSPRLFGRSLISNIFNKKLIVGISAVGLFFVYVAFLSSRALLDADVIHYYLPMAREIVRTNSFTLKTGYDFITFLKPIGVSVLYAWIYVVNGSTLVEAFRLMPLIPLLMLIVLNYAIATLLTKSQNVGIISTAVLLMSPVHDRFLLYGAFHPEVLYYPLTFAIVYFLFEYLQERRDSLLFWIGVALGVASLLKAQTVFVLIAVSLIIIISELWSKKLSFAICCLMPFYVMIPNVLADCIQREGLRISVPKITNTQLGLLFFLVIISSICYYVATRKAIPDRKINSPILLGLVKKFVVFLAPFMILSSLCYVSNFLRFGTLLHESSLNVPDYDWALSTLKSSEPISTPNFWYYVTHFVFMFIDPSMIGYIWLVPLLAGLIYMLRARLKIFNFALFFGATLAISIFSAVIYNMGRFGMISLYDPRTIFILAPLLTTVSSIGIIYLSTSLSKKNVFRNDTIIPLLLVAYFGFMSYSHSVLVLFTERFAKMITTQPLEGFLSIFGLTLTQTSFQLTPASRVAFLAENIWKVFALSFVISIPLLSVTIFQRYDRIKIRTRLKILKRRISVCYISCIKAVVVISLILLVIIVPREEAFIAQGGLQEIKENQLESTYGAVYELFANRRSHFEGDILTFKGPWGLPYYLPGTKVIDVSIPANLLFVKDCLLSNSTYTTVVELRQKGIHYLLVNPSITQKFDASLNFSISKLIQNPELAILSQSLGSWKLYALGPYTVEKTFIPLSGWSVDPRYTNASCVLNSTESSLYLELNATDAGSRVTIRHLDVPKLDLSDYDYLFVKLEGSNNARILMRFFLDDGSFFDVVYWKNPYTLATTAFVLSSYFGRTLRGDAYIALKSSDGTTSNITITEISFVELID